MLGAFRSYPPAEPLTEQEIDETREVGGEELLVTIDDKIYSVEDLYGCEECEEKFTDRSDLDDFYHCEHCAVQVAEDAEGQRQLEADWRASR